MSAPPLPEVDVVVVTWNTADLTAEALRHLLDTDQGAQLRVLVRDNGSTDGTVEAIRERVPEADVDAGEENLGFAAGVNTALARSSAPWVLLLNSDAWPREGAIGRLVEAAEAQPSYAAVAPRLERPDGSLEHSTHPFPSLRVAATMAVGGGHWFPRRVRDHLLLEGGWDHTRHRRVHWAVGAALLIRREALDEIGPLDERFFMYAEDLAWCWEAHQRGWSIGFEPTAVVVHVGNASGEKRYGARRTAAYLQNTERWFLAEHGRVRTRLYRLLNHLGARRAQLAARRRGDPAAAAWWRSIAEIHRAPVPTTDTSRP